MVLETLRQDGERNCYHQVMSAVREGELCLVSSLTRSWRFPAGQSSVCWHQLNTMSVRGSWELLLQSWLRIMYKFLPLKWRDISYEKWNRSQLLFVVTSERSSGYWWWMLLVTMQYDWLVVHNQHLKWCFVIFAHRSLECWLPGISFLVVPRKR